MVLIAIPETEGERDTRKTCASLPLRNPIFGGVQEREIYEN